MMRLTGIAGINIAKANKYTVSLVNGLGKPSVKSTDKILSEVVLKPKARRIPGTR
jgi:hypothetical protein